MQLIDQIVVLFTTQGRELQLTFIDDSRDANLLLKLGIGENDRDPPVVIGPSSK